VVGQTVQQCGGQLGIAEYLGPLRETQIGGDDHTGFFIQFADQVEQQCAADLAERQIPQFIQDDQIDMAEAIGQPALSAVEFFLLQRIDQFHG